MKYRFVGVYQKTDRPSKPWYAVADYYTPEGKRRPKTKTFPEAKGTREAKNLALEWVAELNKQAEEELKEGNIKEGIITRIKPFGAFVEVLPGVEALLPQSVLIQYQNKYGKILEAGSKLDTKVVKLNAKDKRISLGLPEDEKDNKE